MSEDNLVDIDEQEEEEEVCWKCRIKIKSESEQKIDARDAYYMIKEILGNVEDDEEELSKLVNDFSSFESDLQEKLCKVVK